MTAKESKVLIDSVRDHCTVRVIYDGNVTEFEKLNTPLEVVIDNTIVAKIAPVDSVHDDSWREKCLRVIEFDDDGYPTEKSLRRLSEHVGELGKLRSPSMSEMILAFWGALLSNFYGDDAICETKIYCYNGWQKVFRYSTLGWSGNESVISVLKNSLAWHIFWVRSDVGGHYYFRMPYEGAPYVFNNM